MKTAEASSSRALQNWVWILSERWREASQQFQQKCWIYAVILGRSHLQQGAQLGGKGQCWWEMVKSKLRLYRTSLEVQWLRMPASEGDTGSIPVLGRFHMPQGTKPVPHSCWSLSTLGAMPHRRSLRNKKPSTSARKLPLLAAIRESPGTAMKTQHSQK